MLLAFAIPFTASAEQYRSEVREVAPPPAQTQAKDPKELLKTTTDPYARAMLLRDLAATAASSKNYKEAARLLEEALKLNALSGPAAEMMKKDLAALALATGDFRDQVPQLEALVRSGAASPEIFVALGAAYVEKKRFKEAAPLLQKGIAQTPNPDVTWKKALIAALIGSGQEGEAAKQLEALLRADPAQKDAWLQLSALYLKAGNKDRAQATMEIASRLGYLTTADDRLRLVTLTGQLGAPFEAASVLQGWMGSGALARSGANQKLLAALWVSARESALALAVLNDLAASQPSKEIYQQMAQLWLERQDYERASQALKQAMAIGGKNGAELMSLGLARYQLADIDGAIAAFTEAEQFPAQRKLAADWQKYLASG
ncbi:MAG TPA: tetratricopeptide repeat protein, partial [Nevskiaceae bacterium]|nr:tetratricopeptide repeat protein [Nevskiaceae bacterium]